MSVIQSALDADAKPIPSGLDPVVPTEPTTQAMALDHFHQTFFLKLPAPGVDGFYQFEFRARGQVCGGDFQRYTAYSLYIGNP